MRNDVAFEQERDGRWIASIEGFHGVSASGATRQEALVRVEVLALRMIAAEIESSNTVPAQVTITPRGIEILPETAESKAWRHFLEEGIQRYDNALRELAK